MEKILAVENRENVVITHKEITYEGETDLVVEVIATYTCATCGEKVGARNVFFINDKNWKAEMESWISSALAETECYECGQARLLKEYDEREEKRNKEEEARKMLMELGQKRMEEAIANGLYSKDMEKMPEIELPEVKGTEKQVAWVKKIRDKWYIVAKRMYAGIVNNFVGKPIRLGKPEKINHAEVRRGYDFMVWIANHTDAVWWIDNRDALENGWKEWINAFLNKFERDTATTPAEKENEEKMQKAAEEESTVIPENREHDGVAVISVNKDMVKASYKKDEKFRKIVKRLGYRWDGIHWYKSITITTGTAEERAAELGNKLLCDGFAVQIMNADVRKRAVNAEYEPECLRWVMFSESDKLLKIKFEFENYRIYTSARKISGSKYKSPCVTVPVSEYKEVLEFADKYGFKFTGAAKNAIAKVQDSTIKPAPAKDAVYEAKQQGGR